MVVSGRIAVMLDGKIAQLDSPETLYNAPSRRLSRVSSAAFRSYPASWTAAFSAIKPNRWCGILPRVRPRWSSAPKMPGRATLTPTRLIASVRSAAYQGQCWSLTVEIAGQAILLDWPGSARPADRLAFSSPPDRCRLLPVVPALTR